MMSLLMAAPFQFTANVIPEPVPGGAVRDLADIRAPPEFGKGQSPIQSTVLVECLVQPSIGDHAPIAADPAAGQSVERRGAVRAQAVIPARRLVQVMDGPDVIEERGPQLLDARLEAVQVRLLLLAVLRTAQ